MSGTWRYAVLPFLLALGFALSSCGSSGGSSKHTYFGTQSPGDQWTFTLNKPNFSATDETNGYTFAGKVSTLDNGFLKLVVTSTTDPDTPTDGSAVAYGLEVPGVVLLVKPAGTDTQIIAAVAEGSCLSSGSYDINAVTIPDKGWDVTTDDAYTLATLDVSGSSVAVSVSNYLLDGSSGSASGGPGTLTCSKGTMPISGGGKVGITPAGVFVIDSGSNNGGGVGVIAPSSKIGKSALTASGREFRGVLFKYQSSGDDTEPVWVRTKTAGSSLKGGSYTDFEGNVEDTSNTVTLSGFSEPSPGIFQATLTPSSSAYPLTLMVNEIDGKYMIFGVGENDDGGGGPFNVLLIEQ